METYKVRLIGETPLLMHWDNIDFRGVLKKWQKDPANKNRVMLTPEGVDKLRIYAAAIHESPQVVPEFITCQVLGVCPNKKQLWI